MADSINSKAKEYYDNDDTGGSLNSNLKDFLVQQGATGKSINTLWRDYAYGEGGTSLNTRLRNLWGTSGSLMKRWKETLGLTWDEVKAFFNFRDIEPDFLLDGSTSFDGADDYIQIASDGRTDFANQSFTISAWIKPDAVSSDRVIFSYDFTSHTDPFYSMHFRTASSGRITLGWNDGSGTNIGLTSGTSKITAGIWQHVCATYTSGTQKIYLNGLEIASSTYAHTITFYDQEVWIGKGNFGGEFEGLMANVGIWSRALSASEVESIYWRGSYSELKDTELTNLVSWYDLQGDVLDKQGSNDGTNNGATLNTDSYSGESPFKPRIQDKAAPKMAVQLADGSTSFDGTDDYIDLDAHIGDFSSQTTGTISLWFKTASSGYQAFISASDKGDGSSNYTVLMNSGDITLNIRDNATYTIDATNSTNYNDNKWHHLAWTVNGSGNKMYIDGSQITLTYSTGSASTQSYFSSITGLDALTIGGNKDTGGSGVRVESLFNGSMANVAIHSSALTQSQVQELMFTEKYSGLSSDLKTNLVSWYDLGSSSNPHNDLEGSNHGTNNGATVNTGYTYSPHGVVDPLNFGEVYSGRALDFDGSNDYVDLSGLEYSGSTHTFSFWLNSTQSSNIPYLLDFSPNRSALGFNNPSTADVGLYDGVAWKTFGSINDGNWHHLVYVLDGTSATVYDNGSQLGTTQTISAFDLSDTSQGIKIGRHFNSTQSYYDGKMSSVKIFNSALTQSQVRELYTKPETVLPTGVSASNLKLDLPMQEGSGSYIYDGSGNQNHGTISGATWVTGEEYGYQASLVRSNTPMIFDGSDDYVSLGTTYSYTNNTFSAWIKPEANSSADRRIIDTTDGNDDGILLYVRGDNDKIQYSVNGSGLQSASTYNGQWVHVVGTYDGSTQKLYINGSLDQSTSTSQTISTTTNAIIGARSYTSQTTPFKGLINEVAIWDVALDADAVTQLYNSGVPLLPTSDSGNYDNSGDLQGYWRNDGIATWTDRSTNSNNGTASGSPVEILIPEGSTEGRDNQGYYLSDTTTISNGVRLYGGGEYIEIQDSEVLSFGDGTDDTPFSIESWVKMEDATNFTIASKGTYNTDCEYILKCETDKLYFYITDESVTNTYEAVYYNTALTSYEGQWIHLTATYDGRGGTSANLGMKLYLNGSVLTTVADDSGTYVAMENLSAPVYVGRYSSNYSNGLIDEVRIYSKALSASEVLKNYNSGKSSHQ